MQLILDTYSQNLSPLRRRKVLVVDDEPSWLLLIGRILRNMDESVDVQCARNLSQAQRMLFAHDDFDLVVADFHFEGAGTGLDLWRDCQTYNQRVPFMMISAMPEIDFRRVAASAAPESKKLAFFAKGAGARNLQAELRRQLGQAAKAKALPEISPGFAEAIKAAALVAILSMSTLVWSPSADAPKTAQLASSSAQGLAHAPAVQKIFTPQLLQTANRALAAGDALLAAADE